MVPIEQIKQDVREGRIDANRLVDLLAASERQLQAARRQLETANQRIEELQKQIDALQKPLDGTPSAPVDQPFSLRAEEQRQQARGQSKKPRKKRNRRRGRRSTADKIAEASRHEDVFPQGVDPSDCRLSHIRPVWRLENGRAVRVAYHVYRGPNHRYGQIRGVLGRSEFGIEFVLEIAYLVYVTGLSFDKVCALLRFFQNLPLEKSQVDALLHRLARHWEQEFETLCTLLAHSAVVHADETGWSLKSVWAFLSEKARLLFFGVPKDADTLKVILDPATFLGLVISDDAAVYGHFSAAQKCWAHLLRKAIKLTLQDPTHPTYRAFTDRLLAIYREACRVQRDGRLSDAGRLRRVADLDDEILEMGAAVWFADLPPLKDELENDYRLLVLEVMRLMFAQELFTFVTAPPVVQPNGESRPVAGTNNEAERTLRSPAQARVTGRTNKTLVGARRQTILTSVLESLRLYLPCFTLQGVLEEVRRWQEAGRSCFTTLLEKLNLRLGDRSVLDQLLPDPGS